MDKLEHGEKVIEARSESLCRGGNCFITGKSTGGRAGEYTVLIAG